MKGLISLTFYGLLGCSLSMTQVNLFQDTKQILNDLKQLDLTQLLEIKVAAAQYDDCADFPTGKAMSCQNTLAPAALVNSVKASASPVQP